MTTSQRLQTFSMPDVGEGLTEAEVLEWRVTVGDMLTVNQVIAEIETAKAAVELPSPFAGRVQALLVGVGVTVRVGTPIIRVDTQPGAGDLPAAPASSSAEPAGQNGLTATENGGGGAKIGEVSADGRIATLVGYVSAGTSGTRRARRDATTAATPSRARRIRPPRSLLREQLRRWPPRRCASWPRSSGST